MSKHLVFNRCAGPVKERLETYWAKKLPRLQKLLVHYGRDLQEIRLSVTCHQQSPQRLWYEARGVIELPTGTLAAGAENEMPEATLDAVTDALVAEIKRHKEHVRHENLYKRKDRGQEEPGAEEIIPESIRE